MDAQLQNLNVCGVCLTEHWLLESECSNVHLANYNTAAFFARSRRRHGGVIQLTKKDIEFVTLQWISDLSTEINCELAGISIPTYNFIVVTVYRSPSGDFNEFIEILVTLLNRLKCSMHKIIIGGDFNTHFNTCNVNTNILIDLFNSYGFASLVKCPTRGNATLDNIFCNISLSEVNINPLELALSDHIALQLDVQMTLNTNTKEVIPKVYRPITNCGKITFYSLLDRADWSFVDSDIDPNNKFQMFLNNIIHNFNIAFPERTCTVNSKVFKKNRWFNSELQQMRDNLSFVAAAYSTYKTLELKLLKNKLKCKYNLAIKTAKIKSNEDYLKDNNNNPKAMWTIINKYRSETQRNIPQTTPDELNNYFANMAPNLIDSLPKNALDPIELLSKNKPKPSNNFSFRHVTFIEVRDCLNSLKTSKSVDIYGLNTEIIKSIKNIIITPITKLFNCCITESIFPDCLKISQVIPIYKKGDPNNQMNYRPISLLPILSKLFEKLLLSQILKYLNENNILSNSQFGFRKKMSTSHAVLAFVDDILKNFEEKKIYGALFLDLSKAFDTVSHDILLKKIAYYNMDSDSVKLIGSYLQDRVQKVSLDGVLSGECNIYHGVPQGSILGPLLFLIYINDLPECVPQINAVLYADDTTLGKAGSSLHDIDMSKEYTQVQKWLLSNKLHLNAEKTVKMTFSTKNLDCFLSDAVHTKFLGVTVDRTLTWQYHVDTLANKLSKNVYLLRNLTNCISQKTILTAYFALIQSHVEYCIILWGHTGLTTRVFRLQRRAVRVVAGIPYREDCKNFFRKFNILTLPSLYIFKCLEFVIKNKDRYFTLNSFHKYNTRTEDLCFNNLRLTKARHGINYFCIKFYNILPSHIKHLPPDIFLHKIKNYLVFKSFYSIAEYLECDFTDFECYHVIYHTVK